MQNQQSIEILQAQSNLPFDYENVLLNSVDQAFLSFGEATKQRLYNILESEYKIVRSEIPHRVDDFVFALERMLGVSALLVEIYVLKNIRGQFPSFTFTADDGFSFQQYIESFRLYMRPF